MFPESRAEALLLAHLTPEQRDQYKRDGTFEVRGNASNRRYRIAARYFNGVTQLNKKGRATHRLCFYPGRIGSYMLPLCDIMLAQKVALETNEYRTRRKANISSVGFPRGMLSFFALVWWAMALLIWLPELRQLARWLFS